MYDARPGLQVVCIRKFNSVLVGEVVPFVSQVLTIRDVVESEDLISEHPCFLRFDEIVNKASAIYAYREICFGSNNFRPVRKTDISAFTNMLKKTPINKSFEHSDFEIVL
jgi:hypothetical protein